MKRKIVTFLLIGGTLVGFGTGFHRLSARRAQMEHLADVCVDATLHEAGRVAPGMLDRDGRGRHAARKVREHCAAEAQRRLRGSSAAAPSGAPQPNSRTW